MAISTDSLASVTVCPGAGLCSGSVVVSRVQRLSGVLNRQHVSTCESAIVSSDALATKLQTPVDDGQAVAAVHLVPATCVECGVQLLLDPLVLVQSTVEACAPVR